MNKLVFKLLEFGKHNAGKILTGASLAGLTGTAILSAKAATKVANVLNKTDILDEKDEVRMYLSAYGPPVAMGLATAAAIVGIEVLGEKKAAALTAAYGLVSSAYNKYRKKNIDIYGKDHDETIVDAISSEYLSGEYGVDYGGGWAMHRDPINYAKDGIHWFYEPETGIFFKSSMSAFQDARYHLNRNFHLRGYTNVAEFNWLLGIGPEVDPYQLSAEESLSGKDDDKGWNIDYLLEMSDRDWIDICLDLKKRDDGSDYYAIYYPVEPVPYYEPMYTD